MRPMRVTSVLMLTAVATWTAVLHAQRTEPRPVVQRSPVWSPSGWSVAFATNRDGQVAVITRFNSRLLLKVCIEKTDVAWSPNVTGKLVEPVEDDAQLRGSIGCEHPTVLRLKRESRREKLSSDQVAECTRSNETDRAQRQITTVLEIRPKNGTGNKRPG